MPADVTRPRAPRRTGRGWEIAGLIGLAIFAITSVVILDDYGEGIDGPKEENREGAAHLSYLLTGAVDIDAISGQRHGALVFVLAEVAKRFLHDRWHLLDPVTARHTVLPLLVIPFAAVLFQFIRRWWGAPEAFLVVAGLLTYPRFFGHAFHNMKDVPVLIFGSLAIMAFADWVLSKRRVLFYLAFLNWGLALSVKVTALLVPSIVTLWWFIDRRVSPRWRDARRSVGWRHWGVGFGITLLMILAFYAPAWWGVDNKTAWFFRWVGLVRYQTFGDALAWNVYALTLLLYATPLPALVLFFIGCVATWVSRRRQPLHALVGLWFLLPIGLTCLPNVSRYDELRHILMILVPFSILTAVGACTTARWLAKRFRLNETAALTFMSAVLLGGNVHGTVTMHPYQTAYFNELVGGLRGAQARSIPYAGDYWMTSYRECAGWLKQRATAGSTILVQRPTLMSEYLSEPAYDVEAVYEYLEASSLPRSTYVVIIPSQYWGKMRRFTTWKGRANIRLEDVLDRIRSCRMAYRIMRQDGVIATIYDCRAENDPPTPNS